MGVQEARLKYLDLRSCFVNVPREWTSPSRSSGYTTPAVSPPNMQSSACVSFWLRLEHSETIAAVTWSGKAASRTWTNGDMLARNVCEIDSLFANSLGLHDGQEVWIERIEEPVAPCCRVTLAAVESSAWNDIAENGAYIEQNLLDIIRIVSLGLEFPLWLPSVSQCPLLRVADMEPRLPATLLSRETIVEILPSMPEKSIGFSGFTSPVLAVPHNPFPLTSFIWEALKKSLTSSPAAEEVKTEHALENFSHEAPGEKFRAGIRGEPRDEVHLILRIQEIFVDPQHDIDKDQEETALISSSNLPFLLSSDVVVYGSVRPVLPFNSLSSGTKKPAPSYDVSVKISTDRSEELLREGHIGMSHALIDKLNLSRFSPVRLTVDRLAVEKSPKADSAAAGAFIPVLRKFSRSVASLAFPAFCETVLDYVALALSLSDLIRRDFHPLYSSSFPGLLLCGSFGIGKSALLLELSSRLSSFGHMVFCETVECKYLRGKRPDTLRKLLERILDETILKQPSVILLDDVEFLAPRVLNDNEAELDYSYRVAQILVDLLDKIQRRRDRVLLIGTTGQKSMMHEMLMEQVFQKSFDIPLPMIAERLRVLRHLLVEEGEFDVDKLDLDDLAKRTDGYVLRDFGIFYKKMKHHGFLRGSRVGRRVVLSRDAVEAIFSEVKPLNQQKVTNSLALDLEAGWDDVGGLHQVKVILKEVFELPAKYPRLFARCPIRLPRGVLLYGLPGTGKTFIAGILAKEIGISLIYVRGPELLSKYIGASEAKVRDVFERARAARPCLVLFDEFDAIAPRRGHDSTGVTDRVVNQLLTEMDGVEGLEGVYVLAVSSRPELIDPAILRPGRIDKCLYCPLPNLDERLDILRALSKKIALEEDVDLQAVATDTEHFSGADLKSIMTDAQLSAVEQYLGKLSDILQTVDSAASIKADESDRSLSTPTMRQKFVMEADFADIPRRKEASSTEVEPVVVKISHQHVIDALRGKVPSVSEKDRQRFEKLARDMQEKGPTRLQERSALWSSPLRATLA